MGDGTDQVKSLVGQQSSENGEKVGDVKEQVDEQMGPGERLGELTDEGKDSPPRS